MHRGVNDGERERKRERASETLRSHLCINGWIMAEGKTLDSPALHREGSWMHFISQACCAEVLCQVTQHYFTKCTAHQSISERASRFLWGVFLYFSKHLCHGGGSATAECFYCTTFNQYINEWWNESPLNNNKHSIFILNGFWHSILKSLLKRIIITTIIAIGIQ